MNRSSLNFDEVMRHYDQLNRLKTANYSAWNGSDWTSLEVDHYSVGNIDYDANGNILALDRRGLRSWTPDVNGNLVDFHPIDQLTYTYRGNQLIAVEDAVSAAIPRDLTGFHNANLYDNLSDEYLYDANGNMYRDENKGIKSISYNHLNLPTKISFEEDESKRIEYLYDAAGIKLRKQVYDNNSLVSRTDYVGGFVYTDSELEFVHTAEGRYLFTDASPLTPHSSYEYHYKDHLGNLRLAFRDKPDQYYQATMELNSEATAHTGTSDIQKTGLSVHA